jgi:uncharacterized protein (TIRG00374 family)
VKRVVAAAVVVAALAALAALSVWWRGPDWSLVADAFRSVRWRWVVAAILLNLVSVVVRAFAWSVVVRRAMPNVRIAVSRVFAAFCVGLLANAVLPGRVGELARAAVLTRHMPRGEGHSATLIGTVFAHRMFDLVPVVLLVVYVLFTAKIPHWALTSLAILIAIGGVLFLLGVAGARTGQRTVATDGLSRARRVVAMGRRGISVMGSPAGIALATLFQTLGWVFQLLAVYVAMWAFGIHEPLPAAALVLLLMNVATIFPLWPGNFGLLQAAVALPLVQYGVAYARGFAYGLGLQVIEASVGVGIGLVFLAREGLSFAALRRIQAAPGAAMPSVPEVGERGDDGPGVAHGDDEEIRSVQHAPAGAEDELPPR